MTLSQSKLIEDYNSLRTKVDNPNIGQMIQFCTYFQTDDLELYKEYESALKKSWGDTISTDKLIELYAKRYNLNPHTHIEQIMNLFVNNAIINGTAYHLNSSANFDSIMETGLGISAIGLKTEERQDYERLQASIPKETFKRLQPFVGEKKGSKLYYSNIPILKARYGDRPEWLKELKINAPLVADDVESRKLVEQVLHKYDIKYEFAEKMLFLLPHPLATKANYVMKELAAEYSPEQVIDYFNTQILGQKDLHTDQHISSSNIIAVNLKTHDMYAKKSNGEVSVIKPTAQTQK